MASSSYEEVMSELEELEGDEQEEFMEALDSRLERRIEINEEHQKHGVESALERNQPFSQEEFTYFQDTGREALENPKNNEEYARGLLRVKKALEESGQEAGVMDWLSDLDNLVYSIAEAERRVRSRLDLEGIQEEFFSMFEEHTYEALRENMGIMEYQEFLGYVDEVKEMEEDHEFDSDNYISEFEDEMNVSVEDGAAEQAEESREQTREDLETYMAPIPEKIVNKAPHRYREAINSIRSEESGSGYDKPSMKNVVETDFAAALEEARS